jgi:hypothetical protein
VKWYMRVTKPRLIWISIGFAFVLLGACGVMYFEVQPDGIYRNDKVGSEGLALYELSNGTIRLVILSEDGAYISLEKHVGAFSKRNGQWVLTDVAGGSTRIKASVLWLKVYHENWASPETYPRMWRKVNARRQP